MSKVLENSIGNHHDHRAVWIQGMVETPGYFMCETEEGGNGRGVGTEAMLGG